MAFVRQHSDQPSLSRQEREALIASNPWLTTETAKAAAPKPSRAAVLERREHHINWAVKSDSFAHVPYAVLRNYMTATTVMTWHRRMAFRHDNKLDYMSPDIPTAVFIAMIDARDAHRAAFLQMEETRKQIKNGMIGSTFGLFPNDWDVHHAIEATKKTAIKLNRKMKTITIEDNPTVLRPYKYRTDVVSWKQMMLAEMRKRKVNYDIKQYPILAVPLKNPPERVCEMCGHYKDKFSDHTHCSKAKYEKFALPHKEQIIAKRARIVALSKINRHSKKYADDLTIKIAKKYG